MSTGAPLSGSLGIGEPCLHLHLTEGGKVMAFLDPEGGEPVGRP